jgi:hypothetical protein
LLQHLGSVGVGEREIGNGELGHHRREATMIAAATIPGKSPASH